MHRKPAPRLPRRRWPVALALGLMALAGAGWMVAGGADSPSRDKPAATAPPVAIKRALAAPETQAVDAASPVNVTAAALAPVPVAAADLPPAGVSAEQWATLRETLKDHPQRDAELRRVAEFMNYMNAAQRFRSLQAAAHSGPELQQLARLLDAGLPTRLQRQEVSLGEARLLKVAITQALEPDASQREVQLAEWRATTAAVLAQMATSTPPDLRGADYANQQAAAVAAWQALPANQRDPNQLESQLDALRAAAFSSVPNVPNVPNSRPNTGTAPGGSP